jgi:hypothetical protein
MIGSKLIVLLSAVFFDKNEMVSSWKEKAGSLLEFAE